MNELTVKKIDNLFVHLPEANKMFVYGYMFAKQQEKVAEQNEKQQLVKA